MAGYLCREMLRSSKFGMPIVMREMGYSSNSLSRSLAQLNSGKITAGVVNREKINGLGALNSFAGAGIQSRSGAALLVEKKETALAKLAENGESSGNNSSDGSNRGPRMKYGMIMAASSPFLFSSYEDEPTGMSELLFLTGKSIGMCVERLFENEVGNSVFIALLVISYIAILGKEGSLYGFVSRLKYRYATNFSAVTHPKYSYAIPHNPLLKKK